MKTVVTIPENIEAQVKKHKEKYYPDLTIPKMLVRLLIGDIEKKENQ